MHTDSPDSLPADPHLLVAFRRALRELKEDHEDAITESERRIEMGEEDKEDFIAPDVLEARWCKFELYAQQTAAMLEQLLRQKGNRAAQEDALCAGLDMAFDATLNRARNTKALEEYVYFYGRIQAYLEQQHAHADVQEAIAPWQETFAGLLDYGDLLIESFDDLCDMSVALQHDYGSEPIARSVFDYACQRYFDDHPELERDPKELDDEQFKQVREQVQQVVEEILSPYEDLLPVAPSPQMAWFVGRAIELHHQHDRLPAQRIVEQGPHSFRPKRQMPALEPANDGGERLIPQRLPKDVHVKMPARLPEAMNDNTYQEPPHHERFNDEALRTRASQTLSHVLSDMDDVPSLEQMLSAKALMENKLKTLQREALMSEGRV